MKLSEEFDHAQPKDADQLEGEYAVHLVADFLPKPIRFLGHTKVFKKSPGGEIVGYNAFLGKTIKAGHFHVERGQSTDGSDVTKIIYDDRRNPAPVRALTDEVRETSPGRFLGRGMYKFIGNMTRNVFWFTVTKEK